ncbi:MAG: hypothetical protein H0U96_08845 [Acidobacteria bacterium]|jgi:hypothetical protein|nr:hypothetical protein [Acidobacteriota bacterium]
MSKPIYEIVDELPTKGMTVTLLKSLDFVVPGQWQNITGFDNTIRMVTGETDEQMIQQIGERAIQLYNDKTQGYQTALWIYDAVGKGSGALGAAAMANKIGENFSFLSFLNGLTPKADKAQAIDLSVKLVAEIVAYCKINGIPGDSIGEFVSALADYSGESLMRMAALVSVDALLPLGPDFIQKVGSTIGGLSHSELEQNQTFNQINNEIPGGDTGGKLGFIGESFRSVSDWMGSFVSSRNLTQESVVSNLKKYIDITDNKLDYVSAFLDMTTNYYEHTGVQTLARRLTERAVAEI